MSKITVQELLGKDAANSNAALPFSAVEDRNAWVSLSSALPLELLVDSYIAEAAR